jgi:hypothetical protein
LTSSAQGVPVLGASIKPLQVAPTGFSNVTRNVIKGLREHKITQLTGTAGVAPSLPIETLRQLSKNQTRRLEQRVTNSFLLGLKQQTSNITPSRVNKLQMSIRLPTVGLLRTRPLNLTKSPALRHVGL